MDNNGPTSIALIETSTYKDTLSGEDFEKQIEKIRKHETPQKHWWAINHSGRYTALLVYQVVEGTRVVYGTHGAYSGLGDQENPHRTRKKELTIPSELKSTQEVLDVLGLDWIDILKSDHCPSLRKIDYWANHHALPTQLKIKRVLNTLQPIYKEEVDQVGEQDMIHIDSLFPKTVAFLQGLKNDPGQEEKAEKKPSGSE